MAVDPYERALRLTEERCGDAANPDVPTSAIPEMAIRIARLRRDAPNLIWLTMETRTMGDQGARAEALAELRLFSQTTSRCDPFGPQQQSVI